MAILVEHKKSQNRYILLGTGFSIYKSARNNPVWELIQTEEEDDVNLVAVCDHTGEIKWFYSEDLIVIEVDGVQPYDLI